MTVDFKLALTMGSHPDECTFLGEHQPGKWLIAFRGKQYLVSEKTYDRLRYAAELSR